MLAPGNFGCLGLRRGAYWVEQSKASDPPPEGPQEVARGDGGDGAAEGGGVGQMVPKLMCTPCGTRAQNLRIRGPTPCPLGQGGLMCMSRSPRTIYSVAHTLAERAMGNVRCPPVCRVALAGGNAPAGSQ